MEEKLITVVVLPYSKALILKMRLEAKNIECTLENVHLIEGAVSSTVRVKTLEKNIKMAVDELEEIIGNQPREDVKKTKNHHPHILVPVDFSKSSLKSAKMAFNIASDLKSELVFMHCYINPIIYSLPAGDVYNFNPTEISWAEDAGKMAMDKMQNFINTLTAQIGIENWKTVANDFIIKSGNPEDDIISYAKVHKPQLIVMGNGNNKDFVKSVGSVTADVMYNASVPVLVIPDDIPEKKLSEFSTLLYATNFDEKDFVALDKLMSILYPFNVKIICAHVGQPKADGWDLAKLNGMVDILRKKYRSNAFEFKLILGNNVLESLENHIQKENIDILSLTTHKRNMLSRLFHPSLARQMVFHNQTPLLVFHA